jgi:hypothetical protein
VLHRVQERGLRRESQVLLHASGQVNGTHVPICQQ